MVIHTVQPGDTIWNLSRQYGVSPQRILSDNAVINPRNLVIGQSLLILIPEETYKIRRGDTLDIIAERFGVSPLTLLQNNPALAGTRYLRAGEIITIRFQGQKRREIVLNGYAYPYIQQEVLLRCLPSLTTLTIFGYGFTQEGELIPINDQPLINMAYRYKTAPVMLLSSLTEEGTFSSAQASRLFQDLPFQQKVLDQVLAVMREKRYLGLDIDFEYIEPNDAGAYLQFLRNVSARLRPEGFFMNTDLAPKTSAMQRGLLYEAHDYQAVGEISDTVLLMTYEWGYSFGPPMAVAPLNQVQSVVEYGVSAIPASKIITGFPNYGYDWQLPYERGVSKATTIGNQQAIELAARNGAQIHFDQTAASPFFEYWDRSFRKHIVWFEDIRSMDAKFGLIDAFSLLGGAYWNLMRPFAQNWSYVPAAYQIRKIVT